MLSPNHSEQNTESLDPQDWNKARELGHRMLDDMMDYLQGVSERPAWQAVPAATHQALNENVPYQGQDLETIYQQFVAHILPYPTGNIHPRFFGWVMGNGTITGMLADMLASGMNAQVAGFAQSATIVEQNVIAWLAEIMGFPKHASGLLVSGGTMANMNGLAVARNTKAGVDLREQGLQSDGLPKLTVYGSRETHSWVLKSCELMGLGRKAFREVPVNEQFQIDVAACAKMIAEDIQRGCKPICLIGNIGTVNTAAIDDIATLRDLADKHDMWLHIDGAFGSLLAFSEQRKQMISAQSTADSIAFDLHKWGFMPYEVGCILIRDHDAQADTFAVSPSYLGKTQRGMSVDTTYFADRGLQLSRSFRALKVWMSLKEQGVNKIGRIIDQNMRQAQYLAQQLTKQSVLELMAPVSMNIVCFRFNPGNLDDATLNTLNEELLMRLQENGDAVPSQTLLNGQFAIRVCITNHRTSWKDLDYLLEKTMEYGQQLCHDKHL